MNTRLPSPARTARLANLTPVRLRELIAANLDAQEAILRWNAEHGVEVFRMTSNLIPFGSHPVNEIAWWDEFGGRLAELSSLLSRSDVRISTHPGQYIVLSSAQPGVVDAAVAELEYHARLLSALGLDRSHKIVLHVGGGSRDADLVRERFRAGFERLSDDARARLTLENDERWSLEAVLDLTDPLGLPVVLDVFHHELAPSLPGLELRDLVLYAATTWKASDGRQEVHFSTQEPGRRAGAHSETLDLAAFEAFVDEVGDLELDCILEVKDKEQSVLRAQSALRAQSLLRRAAARPRVPASDR